MSEPDRPAADPHVPAAAATADGPPPKRPAGHRAGDAALRLIAAFKLVKAVALVAVGAGLLRYLSHERHAAAAGVINQIRVDSHNRYLHALLARIPPLAPATLKALSVGTFVYAALYAIEGAGLLARRRWAEWMVVVTTGGLLPIELYEVFRRPTAIRVAVLVVNLATVAYLIWLLRRERPPVPSPGAPGEG